MRRLLALLTLTTALTALPALAQEDDNAALNDRLTRLERDVSYVQKQVYAGNTGAAAADGTAPAAPANGGQLQVQITKMEQEIRALRGSIEQNQFAAKQNATDLKKLSDDMEYRIHALEEKQAAAATAAPVAIAVATAAADAPTEPAHFDPNKKPDVPAKADAKTAAAAPAATGNDFPDANAHYSYAFKLLNDKKYSEAATSFDAFVKKYPSDPLTSNAYYWLGESYYSRADYTRAAESFRKGFEVNPSGQKAPDNLYKLSKSLIQVKRVSEACIVLDQIIKRYPDAAPHTVKLATDERTTLQCK